MSSDNASKSASNRSTPEGAPVAATSPKSRSRNDAVRMAELAMAATLARAEAEAQDLQETAEQQAATGVHKAMVESEQSETSVLLARDDREDKVSDSSGSSWVMAQAGQVQPEVRQASQTDCKTTSSDQCDDDKAAWWQTDSSWVKVGLGVGGAMLAAQLLKRDANEPPSELSTGLAAGPFKKNGMTLSYFGTSGLLLELSWDEQGMLTKTVRAALNGDVSILTSKVDTGTGLVDVVTGVEVDFANYTGTLMAVLWDKTDAVPVQFYDEVAGLIALEDTSLRAVTSIQKGPNYLAITPFTELALRKANVPAIDPANAAQITQLLNTPQRVTDINNANKELSTALGVTDIVKVLPVALNDQAFGASTDAQSKLYGEKLASLSRLVPGNLDGGIDKLLNTAPANVPAVIADSLQDYRDDNNPQNPTTPPEVTIVRPWINAAEGRTPVMLRGSSENANEGGVVRITVLKNGVVLATLKTEVDADGHWQVPMPGTLASLGVLDGETLTIRAYIDPDHPASVDARYDATPPAAPQAPADMLASDDSANDSDDLTSQIRPGFQIGALPEEGMTVELLVDGVLVEATYNAQTGVIQPAQSLADGGRRITYRYIDFAGNVGPEGAPLQIVVDSQAPQAPASAPDLQAVSDSGTSQSDNITSDQRPRFVVGAAPEPRLTVELVVDGEVVSATWDANTGTLRPTEAMSHGSHTVAYRWVDAAGNASEAGPALNVDVDTVAPTARFIQVALSNDTGSSATDLVTKSAAQNITAQLSGALFPGDQVWASSNGGSTWTDVSSMVNANGQLRWNGVTLSGGANSLQFKVIDAAGNAGAISTQAYTLDTTPSALTVSSVRISNDTGLSDSDFVTRAAAQTVSGELQLSGLATALASGDRLMGSSNGGATWQDITSSVNGTALTWNNVTLSNGANSLRFKVIDLAGNEGAVSTQNYTLDTVAPAAPESFSWATYPNGISSSSNSVSGNIGLVPFTYTLTSQNTAPLNLNSSSNLANHSFFPTGYGVPNQTSIRNDLASINTLTFDSPMSNLVLAFSSIGNPSTPVSINFPQPVEILWSTGYGNGPDVRVDVGTRSAATQITGWEGNMVVRFNGTVDQFVFNYLSNETYVNFAFGASVFDLLAPEQDTGIKSIDDITHVTRPAFKIQNKPSDAVSAELLINGQLVAATYNAADASLGANNAADDTLTPNLPLSDGVYQVSYRFIDLAGNASAGGSVTTVTIDTRAPVNTSLNTFTPDAIGGNYEPGTTLSLKVNGVSINANRLLLNATNGTWSFVPTQSELTQAGTGLLNKATSTFDLTATDLAGNETVASKTVTKDVFNAPYVKEFIPTDGGILANDSTGHATLNLVFSKAVQAGTGKIKLFDVSNDALVAEIDVTSNAVRIEGNDLYVTLPTLSTGTRYYVTLDAGTFVDSAGQAYLGKTETGTAGWDFTGALASIAPDFVAQDDIVNANESAAVVRITGKVVSSVAVLEDIVAGDLSVNVVVPQGAAAVTATLQSYNNQTGEFVFTVPAQAWANGNYGYTVSLHGSTGDAASVTASYNFANLAVDLVAPTGIIGSIDRIMDDTGQSQGNLFPSSLKMLDSGFGSTTGTTKVTDVNVTDLDLTVLTATMAGAYVPGAVTAVYNSGSTVYNSDRSSVSFWVQYTDSQYTKALQLRLTDAASGIELKVLQARYQSGALATTHNWNQSPGNFMTVAGSLTGGGYGLSALEFGSGSSAALQSNGLTDDNTPTLGGGLTRALAQGERVAIDRTDGQGNVVTITGKDGLIVDGTTWTFNDGTLADGRYTYRLYVEDAAGNRTASSTARTITVDTAAPTAVVTAATLSQDTGVSNTDRLTKVAAQTVTGTLNAALGAGEKLMASLDGGTTFIDITSTVSNTSFNWTNATLRDGSGRLTFKVVDAMGNVGTVFEQSYTLDTAPPATPTVAAVRVDVDSDKILTGTAQLAAGDSLSVSVNGAVYQVTPDNQGAWQLNLATTTASSGVLGAWTAGQKYEVAVTITDAAGNTAVDTSTQEITIPANGPVPLRTIDVSGLVTSYGAYQPIKPHDQFGNVLIKETDGHFTVPLGVTILDSSSTFTGTVGTWGTFSTELAPLKENPVLYQDYYWGKLANTVSSPKIPASGQSGYVLRDFSADSNTPASIAQFLNANSITAKSDSVDKFYLILNVDDIDGTGQSGAVVAYVNGTRTAIAGIDAGSITVVDSYIGHTASEFTADNFMSGNSPLATTWIDDAANSTVIGTSANDRLYAGTGADVIKGNGGFDEITLATDAHSDIIYFQNLPGFTAVKNFQITATGSVRDQFDFSEFGFYREDLQVLPSQNSYGGSSGYNSFPRGVNASGKILAASYMYQSGFTAAGIIDNDLFKIVDTAHEVKNLFSSGFLVLDDNSESIVITTQNGLGAYIFHVEDIDTSAGMNMSVTPLGYFWGTEPYIHILTAENITARPPQPDYISIGRLDAGKTAFGAWFDTDKDGVHDNGEAVINLNFADRGGQGPQNYPDYYYKLEGVDFAAGDYTVRFVDPVFVPDDYGTAGEMMILDTALRTEQWDDLGLDQVGFGAGDRVIIDKRTNASEWTNLTVSQSAGKVTVNDEVLVTLGVAITQDNLTFIV